MSVQTRLASIVTAVALALLALVATPVAASADPNTPDNPGDPGGTAQPVRVYDYDLGDAAFHMRGFDVLDDRGQSTGRRAPMELIGRVYAPEHAAGARLPLVVLAHGLFWTCADKTTGKVRGNWPCRGHFRGIHSERGYGYVARSLAARGMLVVSISANGVNAGPMGEIADRARGRLVYKHLQMWRNLVEKGTGRLVGAFVDAQTREPAAPDFRHAADLRNVGLMGHSRGGRGMMWAAADAHHDQVPHGVRLRAVFGMAAAEPPFMDHATRRLTVTKIPLMSWIGGCDVTGDDSYNRLARRGGDPVNIAITVHGANHNNLNTRWAAGHGPGSEDDAQHPEGQPEKCYEWDPAEVQDTLGYRPERQVARAYVTAFFARYLHDDTSYDDMLTGASLPMQDVATVDVRLYPPRG